MPGTFQRLEARIRGIPFTRGFRPFQEAEAEATSLRLFHHTLLSGLFQTEDYARTLMEEFPGASEGEAKERLGGRMERQRVLDGTVVQDSDTAEAMIALFDALRTEARTGSASLRLIEEKARWWREQITT